MLLWDKIRGMIARGDDGSRPRDIFETILSALDEERSEAAAEIERLRLSLSEARATGRREEQDVVDKATAWDACSASFQKGRKAGMEEAARIGYRVCAETRHVTLGNKVDAAIRAAMEKAE